MIRMLFNLNTLKKNYQRLLLRIKIFCGINRSKVSISSNLIMNIRHNDIFGRALLKGNIPEPVVTSYLLSLVKPGMTMLDIGANIGYMTLICSQAVGNMGKVISFEPNPIMLQELKHNLELNNISNVIIEPIALGDINGKLELVLPEIGKESHSSLRPNSTFTSVGTTSVLTETLDSVVKRLSLKNIDIIKIDVEGAELLVLKGGEEVLTKMRPLILFESAENLTEAFGYSVCDVLFFVGSFKYQLKQISYGNWLALPK